MTSLARVAAVGGRDPECGGRGLGRQPRDGSATTAVEQGSRLRRSDLLVSMDGCGRRSEWSTLLLSTQRGATKARVASLAPPSAEMNQSLQRQRLRSRSWRLVAPRLSQ